MGSAIQPPCAPSGWPAGHASKSSFQFTVFGSFASARSGGAAAAVHAARIKTPISRIVELIIAAPCKCEPAIDTQGDRQDCAIETRQHFFAGGISDFAPAAQWAQLRP